MKVWTHLAAAVLGALLLWWALDRVDDAERAEWKADSTRMMQQIAIGAAEQVRSDAEKAILRARNDSLEQAKQPLPLPRDPLPPPEPPAGTPSDSAAYWKADAERARALVDSQASDLRRFGAEVIRLSAVEATLRRRIALDSTDLERAHAERDSLQRLVRDVPEPKPSGWRIPGLGIPGPRLSLGYGVTVLPEPDETGKEVLVVKRGVQAHVGWDLLELVGVK